MSQLSDEFEKTFKYQTLFTEYEAKGKDILDLYLTPHITTKSMRSRLRMRFEQIILEELASDAELAANTDEYFSDVEKYDIICGALKLPRAMKNLNSNIADINNAKLLVEASKKSENFYDLHVKFTLLSRAAELGSSEAMYLIAKIYEGGWVGSSISSNELSPAVEYFSIVNDVKQNMHFELPTVIYRKYSLNLVVEWMQKAFSDGYKQCGDELAELYLHGKGTAKNPVKAFEIMKEVYDSKQYSKSWEFEKAFGNYYFEGIGTEIDYRRAFKLYENALRGYLLHDKYSFIIDHLYLSIVAAGDKLVDNSVKNKHYYVEGAKHINTTQYYQKVITKFPDDKKLVLQMNECIIGARDIKSYIDIEIDAILYIMEAYDNKTAAKKKLRKLAFGSSIAACKVLSYFYKNGLYHMKANENSAKYWEDRVRFMRIRPFRRIL